MLQEVRRITVGWAVAATALVLSFAISGCQNIGMSSIPMYQEVGFDQVKPILESRCLPCHQGDYMGASLPDFRTAVDVYNPDRQPPLVVPGKPEKSRLLQVVYATEKAATTMPPVGHGLTVEEKDIIGEWIRQGAAWPDGEVLQAEALKDRRLHRR